MESTGVFSTTQAVCSCQSSDRRAQSQPIPMCNLAKTVAVYAGFVGMAFYCRNMLVIKQLFLFSVSEYLKLFHLHDFGYVCF